MKRKIVNSPNPDAVPTLLPDGTRARLVELGPKITMDKYGSKQWWPTAESEALRAKLSLRINREGWLLPNYVAICVALLAEIYTTTSSSAPPGLPKDSQPTRYRLQAFGSPISDFGIAKGKAHILPQNCLAYRDKKTGKITKGQDPNEHYWIYFQTLKGEEYALDCGVFTFNMASASVWHKPYTEAIEYENFPFGPIPALFANKTVSALTDDYATTEQRFSALRDEELQEAVKHSKEGFGFVDTCRVFGFLEEIAGRPAKDAEIDMVMLLLPSNCQLLEDILKEKSWLKWPKDPETYARPECDVSPEVDMDKLKFVEQQVRRFNRGEISKSDVRNACKKKFGKRT
jgi:hypothetical protein